MLFVNDIIFPDIKILDKKKSNFEELAAFISDTHVGSKMFLEKNFLKFIKWLNGDVGNESQKQEARRIKYLLITGDTIDGIGVYPGQESLLTIKDIDKQYETLAEYLGMIRKDVTIVLCPGQHDAVRVAEPQPAIDKEHGYALHEMENVILVSNPAMIEIMNGDKRGMRILMYHGASMHSLINEIDSLRIVKAHDTPSKVVKHILKMRHLSPMHSLVTYIPNEKEDELVIREAPDIVTTADLHKPDIDMYKNILIVCSSCWQSITPFEEKVGNHPDPCKVPIFNLKTRQIKIMDFSEIENDNAENKAEVKLI
jgi:DNA polymerase II small subunit